jgi:hypothetical protein
LVEVTTVKIRLPVEVVLQTATPPFPIFVVDPVVTLILETEGLISTCKTVPVGYTPLGCQDKTVAFEPEFPVPGVNVTVVPAAKAGVLLKTKLAAKPRIDVFERRRIKAWEYV